jgi:GNAT superfamily N-acetyltransferase
VSADEQADLTLRELAPPVAQDDVAFVASCLSSLFAPIGERAEDLRAFLDDVLSPAHAAMLIVEHRGARVGLVTLVRVPMPRYLGFAYEIEELVIATERRGRGYARRVLQLVADRCRMDPLARKVVVRTNVPEARRAYATVWSSTDMTSYQTMLNLLQPPASREP